MENENIDAILEANRPRLTTEERERVWQKVHAAIAVPQPIVSPYWNFVTTIPMTPFIIALMIVLGAGGTVAVAEASKPGDVLFPLERAAERVRLAFASDDGKRALRSQFADERLSELRAILDEEAIGFYEDSSVRSVVDKRAPMSNLEIEVDVFTDTTVVKVEENDVITRFMTNATTKDEIVAEIMNRYGYIESEVTSALNFEVEDRASRPSERGGIIQSNLGEARVAVAVNALLDELDSLDDNDNRNRFIAELLREINDVAVSSGDDNASVPAFTNDACITINDERIEIRENGYRVRLESDDRNDDLDDDRSDAAKHDDRDDGFGFDDSDSRNDTDDDRDDGSRDDDDDRDDDRNDSDDERDDEGDDRSGKGSGNDDSDDDAEEDESDD